MAHRGQSIDENERTRRSAAMKRRWEDPDYRERQSAGQHAAVKRQYRGAFLAEPDTQPVLDEFDEWEYADATL